MTSTALVPSCSAEAIQAERDAVVRWAEQVGELIRSAPAKSPKLYIDEHRWGREEFKVANVTRDADAYAWNRLLQESGLWSFMDAQAREEWRLQIHGPNHHGAPMPPLPAFTVAAAEDVARGIHEKRGAMVARGVEEVHRRLSGAYRSNEPARFGPRMVLRHLGHCWGSGKWLSISNDVCDRLDDLARFLRLARGIPEDDHRRGCWHQLSDASNSAPCTVELEFFTVKVFKNGNGHLWFRYPEDVARLNRMLAYGSPGRLADTHRQAR